MNIIKKNKIFIYLFFVLLFGGCKNIEDVADIQPTTILVEEAAIRTPADADRVLTAAYAQVRGLYLSFVSTSDYCSDDLKIDPTGGNRGQAMYNYIFDSNTTSSSGVWSASFIALNYINITIKRLNEMDILPADVSTKNRILGEAYALRAFVHFDLLRFFASDNLGVPYIERPTGATDLVSRLSTSDCYAKIMNDITTAQGFLPVSTYPMNAASASRLNSLAVTALKARIHLVRGEWANAISTVNQILPAPAALPASVRLSARTDFASMYRPPYPNASNPNGEILFKLVYLSSGEGTHGNTNYYTLPTNNVFFQVTSDLLGLYVVNPTNPALPTDIRFSVYFGKSSAPIRDVVFKYISNSASAFVADFPVFRTSELYLIRAEANARLNNITDAEYDFNTLRRARISNYADISFTSLSQNAVIGSILSERRRELTFEGHRFLDIRRLGLPLNRLDCSSTEPNGCNIPLTSPIYYKVKAFPIPFQERLTNPNMVQNPGY